MTALAAASILIFALAQIAVILAAEDKVATAATATPGFLSAPLLRKCGKPLTGTPWCPLRQFNETAPSSTQPPFENAGAAVNITSELPPLESCWVIVSLGVPVGCGRLAYATLKAMLDSHYSSDFVTLSSPSPSQIVEEASKHARVLVDLSFYSSLDDYLDVFQNSTMIFELRAATVNNSDGHSFITHEDGDSELPMGTVSCTRPAKVCVKIWQESDSLKLSILMQQCKFPHHVTQESNLLDEHRRYEQILSMAAALGIKTQNETDTPSFQLEDFDATFSPATDRENSSVEAQLRHRMAIAPNDTESGEEPFLLPCLSPPTQSNASSTGSLAEISGVHIITTIFGNHSPHRLIELTASLYKNIILAEVADITVITERIAPEEVHKLLECVAQAHYQDSHHLAKCEFYKVGVFLKRGLRLVERPGNRTQLEGIIRKKLHIVEVSEQPTYSSYLQYAYTHFPNQMVAITNSDIYFDGSLSCAINGFEEMKRESIFIALTRAPAFECPDFVFSNRKVQFYFDVIVANSSGFQDTEPFLCGFRNSTADSFIFIPSEFSKIYNIAKGWMKKTGILKHPAGRFGELYREILDLDFPQNRFGAENAFSQVMQDLYGYTVINGCRRIAARHLHCTFERQNATTLSVGPQGAQIFRLDGFEYPDWLETCPRTTVKWTMWGK